MMMVLLQSQNQSQSLGPAVLRGTGRCSLANTRALASFMIWRITGLTYIYRLPTLLRDSRRNNYGGSYRIELAFEYLIYSYIINHSQVTAQRYIYKI